MSPTTQYSFYLFKVTAFFIDLLSFGERYPAVNFSTTELNMALASLAKSRSRISMVGTDTMANASLSSLVAQVPSYKQKKRDINMSSL